MVGGVCRIGLGDNVLAQVVRPVRLAGFRILSRAIAAAADRRLPPPIGRLHTFYVFNIKRPTMGNRKAGATELRDNALGRCLRLYAQRPDRQPGLS